MTPPWHIHLSFYRKFATSQATADDIISVLLAREVDDLNKDETMQLISAAMQSLMYGGSHGSWSDADYAWINNENNGVGDRLTRLEDAPDVVDEIAKFGWSYHFGGDHGRWTHDGYPSLIGEPSEGVDDRLKRLE